MKILSKYGKLFPIAFSLTLLLFFTPTFVANAQQKVVGGVSLQRIWTNCTQM